MAESGKIPRDDRNMHIIWGNGFVLAIDESFFRHLDPQRVFSSQKKKEEP
jgi:hypothetical protein